MPTGPNHGQRLLRKESANEIMHAFNEYLANSGPEIRLNEEHDIKEGDNQEGDNQEGDDQEGENEEGENEEYANEAHANKTHENVIHHHRAHNEEQDDKNTKKPKEQFDQAVAAFLEKGEAYMAIELTKGDFIPEYEFHCVPGGVAFWRLHKQGTIFENVSDQAINMFMA